MEEMKKPVKERRNEKGNYEEQWKERGIKEKGIKWLQWKKARVFTRNREDYAIGIKYGVYLVEWRGEESVLR